MKNPQPILIYILTRSILKLRFIQWISITLNPNYYQLKNF